MSDGMDLLYLIAEIEVLSDYERVCRRNFSRLWFLPYLSAVLDLVDVLGRGGVLDELVGEFARKRKLHTDKRTDPIKIVIDASSRADYKTRSRWGRALRYAQAYREEWGSRTSLSVLFAQNGGVSGCAARA